MYELESNAYLNVQNAMNIQFRAFTKNYVYYIYICRLLKTNSFFFFLSTYATKGLLEFETLMSPSTWKWKSMFKWLCI